MRRRSARSIDSDPLDYWPGIADALLASLMIVMLLAFGGLVLYQIRSQSAPKELRELRAEIAKLRAENSALHLANRELAEKIDHLGKENRRLLADNTRLDEENSELRAELEKLKRQVPQEEPPIIEMTDVKRLSFVVGSANVSAAFRTQLHQVHFPEFLRILSNYEIIDTIEMIGHTDESPVNAKSNLDDKLGQIITGESATEELEAGSNVDLGLMRAFAVREEWLQWLSSHPQNPRIRGVSTRCYSASHSVPPERKPSEGTEEFEARSRRIEIRFTQLDK